eukprot:CFRG8130T1
MESFEITEYDLKNEFNPKRTNKRARKEDQIYGIWAEGSGSEGEDEHPGLGCGNARKLDQTTPMSFIRGDTKSDSGENGDVNSFGDKVLYREDEGDDVDMEDSRPAAVMVSDDTPTDSETLHSLVLPYTVAIDPFASTSQTKNVFGIKAIKQQQAEAAKAEAAKAEAMSFSQSSSAKQIGKGKPLQTQLPPASTSFDILAKPKRLDRDFGNWEKHTKGIGAKLLGKMGWQKGQGIGRQKEGIVNPVEAAIRMAKKGGLGFGGDERTKQAKEAQQEINEAKGVVDEEAELRSQLKLWKKGIDPKTIVEHERQIGTRKMPKQQYTFAASSRIGAASAKVGSATSSKVIDMTGRETKIHASYHEAMLSSSVGTTRRPHHAITATTEDEATDSSSGILSSNYGGVRDVDISLPELQHNVQLLCEFAEGEIQSSAHEMEGVEDSRALLANEANKLENKVKIQQTQIQRLQTILETMESVKKRQEGEGNGVPLDIDEAKDMFLHIQSTFHDEFVTFNLAYLAVGIVFPLVEAHLREWEPLRTPRYGVDLFRLWKDVLSEQSKDSAIDREFNVPTRDREMDVYERLLWLVWMPHVRRGLSNWDPVQQGLTALTLVEAWKAVLPEWVWHNIIEQLVYPKISKSVNEWRPQTDPVPIHSWLFSWLQHLGHHNCNSLFPILRQKILNALLGWDASDPSAHAILQEWKKILPQEEMDILLSNAILPKLSFRLRGFVINPQHQDLGPFTDVMQWIDILPHARILELLEQYFFPQWFNILVQWLNHSPDYDEVTRWYLGWKGLFPVELVSHPPMQVQFKYALDTMNQAVSFPGKQINFTSPPPMNTMAYFQEMDRQKKASAYLLRQKQKEKLFAETGQTTFKEVVQRMAEENGLSFQPKRPQRMEKGNVIYTFGTRTVYIDRNVVFVMQATGAYLPASLDELVREEKTRK